MKEKNLRKIIHVDMDAFFASIEQRDHLAYRGKPVIVGGLPHTRGVVATCSYEARKFGIHSAMPSRIAYQRCPEGIFVRPRMERYREISRLILSIFRSYTDLVEPIALDEAYLDVTHDKLGIGSATIIARMIKQQIYKETELTASAGVSYNKFLAKIASDYQKPNGLTVVTPEQAEVFIDQIPIGKFFGVGKVTEPKFLERGILNGADLRKCSVEELYEICQSRGKILYQNVRGIDDRPVQPNRKRKSLGKETTLAEDVHHIEEMIPVVEECARQVSKRLVEQGLYARTLILKVRFQDFRQITRSVTIPNPTNQSEQIIYYAKEILERIDFANRGVRLLGVTTADLQTEANLYGDFSSPTSVQLELFRDWTER